MNDEKIKNVTEDDLEKVSGGSRLTTETIPLDDADFNPKLNNDTNGNNPNFETNFGGGVRAKPTSGVL